MSIYATPKDLVPERLKEVLKLIGDRNLPAAARKLNAIVKSAPSDPRAYLVGMHLAEAAGNPQGAMESMRRSVALEPGWPVAAVELALLLARQNQFEEALEQAERAVALAPDSLDVLTRVVDVAHRAHDFTRALQWLERALTLAPENTQLKALAARDLRLLGRHAESFAAYTALAEAHPDKPELRLGSVRAALMLGQGEIARGACEKLLAIEPTNEEFLFWHVVAEGKTPATLPSAIVQSVFDGIADVYEQLAHRAHDGLPERIATLIMDRYPERTLNLLDLGSGTGLLGARLGRVQGALVAVDLSTKMIEQAIRHDVYARFHTVDLRDALAETPAALYDVIAACDAFPYVGDLAEAIPNAHRILVPGGHLVFSCEAARDGEADLVLRPTLRYAHQRQAIEAQCRAAGFTELSIEPIVLHRENNEPLDGFIVVARKAA